MTDNESDTQDVSDAALERAGVFGYDETGSKHMFDPIRAQVIVVDGDDGVEHVEQLARDQVQKWIAFVHERRGWIDQWFAADAGEAMERHQIAEARAADEQYERAKQEAGA